jgi:hypothetical protein
MAIFKVGDIIETPAGSSVFEVLGVGPVDYKLGPYKTNSGPTFVWPIDDIEQYYQLKTCPVIVTSQQSTPVLPKGPKFRTGDKIRSIDYPEVVREVLGVTPTSYIIYPYISGQDKNGHADKEHLESLYEKCGIPEQIQIDKPFCRHDWKEYIGIYNHYYYCTICNERKDSERP